MEEFRFENTVTLTESQYLAIWTFLPNRSFKTILKLAALSVVGVVFLFSVYTALLGSIALLVVALYGFTPKIASFGNRSSFRAHKYLRDALTYGVSDQRLWVKGARMDTSVAWSMLATWRETEGWLVLSPSGIPPLYLSLARLKEEGLYGRVRALAASNAPEFNKSGPR